MTSSIRILTPLGLDSNPSLLLVSPNGSKTLINCGEGCQRAFLESSSFGPNINVGSLRISSVNRLCLTHIGHDAFGGLPGMILTTADVAESAAKNFQQSQANGTEKNDEWPQTRINTTKRNGSFISEDGNEGIPNLEIVGPVGTRTFIHALRHFMRRDRFNVHVHEGIFHSSLRSCEGTQTTAPKKKQKKSKPNTSNDSMEFTVKSIPIDYHAKEFTKQAISYIFTTPPIPGKFLIEKANELKIPRGPMYAELKAGKSVTFIHPDTNEERTVTPEEVLAEGSGGLCVIVMYCPSLIVLHGLQQSDFMRGFHNGLPNGAEIDAVVHLTPKRVYQTDEYQAWCTSLGTNPDHIALHVAESLEDRVSNSANSPFVSAMRGAVRRSFVNNTLFPLPKLDFEKANNNEQMKDISGCAMMEYVLLPRSRRGVNMLTTQRAQMDEDLCALRTEVYKSGAIELGKEIAATETKKVVENTNGNESSNMGELIFTGTGSAVPCKHRNVTGMYLRMCNGNSMLLDIGEGTIGQLLHSWRNTLNPTAFLVDEYRSRIQGIKAVWISHPHADHHLGILRLLSERILLCGKNDPIVLMAPPNMIAFLSEYQSVVPEIAKSYIAVDSRNMREGFQTDHAIGMKLFSDLGITQCTSVPVSHCPNSFAIIVDGTSFGRVAYSGDCRPSDRFASAAFDADLLIHEATFEDGMQEEAVLKRHSTVGEAINIALKMKAKSLVLTHFSQRYPKIPPVNLNGRDEITVAFDFMILKKESMHLASKLTPALRLLYPNDSVDDGADMTEDVEPIAKNLLSVPGVFAAKGIL